MIIRKSIALTLSLLCACAMLSGCGSDDYVIVPPAQTTTTELSHLSMPRHVTAEADGTSITIHWDKVDNAEGYQIFGTNGDSEEYIMLQDTPSTYCTFTGLTSGKTYSYFVRAYASGGTDYLYGEPCEPVSAQAYFGALSEPSGFHARAEGDRVVLTWGAVDGADGYELFQQSDREANAHLILTLNTTSASVSGLEAGRTYSYFVQAYMETEDGTREYGKPSEPMVFTPTGELTEKPEHFTCTAGDGTVSLEWDAVSSADGYEIFCRFPDEINFKKIGTTEEPVYLAEDLQNAKKYYFYVRAYRDTEQGREYSPLSDTKHAAPVAAPLSVPRNFRAAPGDGCVTLSWGAVLYANSYMIYMHNPKTDEYEIQRTVRGATKTVIKDLENGTEYSFLIRAVGSVNDSNRYSTYSEPVAATPKAPETTASTAATTTTTKQTAATTTKTTTTTTASSATSPSVQMEEVLRLVNEIRAENGLSALTAETSLTAAANCRAKEVSESFSHTRPDGSSCFTVLREYNVDYMGAGENIAMGFTSAEAVVAAWMNSDGHRANILNASFTKLGVGYDPTTYSWVQLFIY